MAQTKEIAFETYVQQMLLRQGWQHGEVSQWDLQRALFPSLITTFIRETQKKLWEEMLRLQGEKLEELILSSLIKELEIKGSLFVLRHGFKFFGKTFRLAYFKPAHGLNDEILALYAKNILTVTRQVPCHLNDHCTLDLVFAINGVPVATCELKNPGTGQTWRNAVKQYQEDRNPAALMFEFQKRTLVHFAADPDEVHMCTRLSGIKSSFLPFNRGSHPGEIQCGAGNPQHVSGYRTGYFWEEVLERNSFLDIVGHLLFVEKKERKETDSSGHSRIVVVESLVFPRYHQLDATRKLVHAARLEGPGKNYLIQHSAGSGKTNSIAWLSHGLASLHDSHDHKVFDCVVVITDRQVLDRQLQEAIYQIEHAQGVVKAVDKDSKQLAEALIDGTKIVVTTLQKFPFVLRGLLHAAGTDKLDQPTEEEREQAKRWEIEISKRRYAVIVDEAHSSQSGESARELKAILGSKATPDDPEEPPDWEDRLNQVMQSRGHQHNVSFFAYTATPKGKTLELFGRRGASGKPEAFHLYSMRQAIEERFILDVVKNYTTYKTYFKLVKSVEDDPNLPKRKAVRALSKFLVMHPTNIEQKTEVIIEHFRRHVRHHIAGLAKAMVVTSSRIQAIKYMLAFQRYIKDHHYSDVHAMVAFSGTVKDPDTGLDYTEPGMNIDIVSGKPISEKQLPERFASPDYQLLLVANKYQTGFDQPLLLAMYVDKRLDGVQAVQTLSRLNRMVPGKSTPFVLDFVNEAHDIYKAFKPYYDATSLQEESDPSQLDKLKHELDMIQIYHWNEVEAFARIFYRIPDKQTPADHAHLQKHLQPAVDRFKVAKEEERTQFYDKLSGYVRIYAFLSQILPYGDPTLEMLYSYGRFLLPHLPLNSESEAIKVADEVGLQYYRLERVFSGTIDLRVSESVNVKSPTDVGSRKAKEVTAPLSEIIDVLNERFSTNFNDEDRLFFEQIKQKATNDPAVIRLRQANPFDKFQLGLRKLLEDLMIQRMNENDKIVTRYMDDKAFEDAAFAILSKLIYETIPASSSDKNKST